MRGRRITYSADELAWLEANRTMVVGDYHRAFCDAFGRDDVTADNLNALRKRRGWKTGRTGWFEKGQPAPNRGRKYEPGKGGRHPNAQRTQFKPGVRQGIAVRLYKPIGTERISKSGYRERKIHDGMPLQSRWRAVHLLRWEEANGPLPKDMALKCLDGDRLNTDPSNWELVPRAILPRLNGRFGRGFDAAPAELKPTILAVTLLEHGIRTAKRAPQA